MENFRLFLFLALGVVLMLIWTAWQEDYGRPSPPPRAADEPTAPAQAPAGQAPAADREGVPAADRESGEQEGRTIRVVTDLLDVEINTLGGDIVNARLLGHTVSTDNPSPFPLLHADGGLFIAQSGLIAREQPAPDHRALWQAEAAEYRMRDGVDEIAVPLTWTDEASGVTVTKRYVFRRDRYLVRLEHEVRNEAPTPWEAYQYTQLRHSGDTEGRAFLGARSYTGGVIYSQEEKYEKISFDDMAGDPMSRDVQDGWAAMIQHYFLAAWIPPRGVTERYYTRFTAENQYVLGMSSPWQAVAPGATATFANDLFIGPKEQDRLEPIAQGLELTVDYGWLTIISKPLFIALSWIHGIVGNWGWAIVILTLGIKLAFYKLSETSYRSMARMRKLQPKMQQLKERLGEDRQRMNQELMELYKKEKVNPLGGCLPIVIQIPVFIALYWVLLESVELRQAPWILWIQDLSVRDPFYVLPIVMGATMLLQQRLNPAPMDPVQQKVMMALPIVFTVFFLFFPAGLVLYWVTNNTLSILQQWVITRRVEAGETKKANA